jgi:hypothetical protein
MSGTSTQDRDFTKPSYKIVKHLGRGEEGVVYLLADRYNKDHLVLKVLFEPRASSCARGIELYGAIEPPSTLGLPTIYLVRDSPYVVGYWYPHTKLYHVHFRILCHLDVFSQALLSAIFRMQSYLMANHHLALHNAVTSQFMLSRQGRFHFVDFGWAISSLESPSVLSGTTLQAFSLSLDFTTIGLRNSAIMFLSRILLLAPAGSYNSLIESYVA